MDIARKSQEEVGQGEMIKSFQHLRGAEAIKKATARGSRPLGSR